MSRGHNPSIFREYDIRGIADVDYDADFARLLGRAYATYAADQGMRRVSVGRDARLTSNEYAEALKDGLRAGGLDVVDLGMTPTPLVYYSLHHCDVDGGIQVTGSHNPSDHNGFKLCVGKVSIYGDAIQELRRIVESGRFRDAPRGGEEHYAIIPPYQEELIAQFGTLPRRLKVVVDSGNGAAGPVAPRIVSAIGCDVRDLFSEPDGRFPNHHPDPTVEENMETLIDAVKRDGADLGIAFDGDADRVGLVDRHGRILWGDEMLVLFARDILATRPGAVIVSEVKCSQRLYDDIAKHGGKGIMWKAGHSLLKAKMRETKAALGGEMSGHIFFADRYYGYDDAIYAACRMLEVVAKAGKPVAELLADLPPAVSTPEIRVDCPDALKFRIAERAKERFRAAGYDLIDIDGVRVKFADGWGLIRASNTQPILVMRFEATDAAKLAEYRGIVEKVVDEVTREIGAA
ncbi:MAG: phosphomannomutase/phosphoglucomutase [Deltaproteobacteria bacterium]|nr:phosphomannomutase/phosphoglucomutase [Deltaproteobacteria bacterium]